MPALKKYRRVKVPELVRQAVVSWLFAVLIEYLLLPAQLRSLSGLEGLSQMSFVRVAVLTCAGTLLLWLIGCFVDIASAERWYLAVIFGGLAATALWASFSWAFLAVCLLIFAGVLVFALYGWDSSPEPEAKPQKAPRIYVWITAFLAAAFFLFVSVWTVCRVNSFSTPTYDFGIFSQMFYNMTQSGLPMTTVERDGLLSHFDVHMSPIYYLMLPFYWLVPTPATLQVLQAAVLASSVIPLWLIGKQHGLSGLQRTLLCAVLLLFPAFSGGTSYDIHENCFLTPCILWLLYGIDRKNIIITGISALLTLMIKEDAAVYVAVIGLWLIVKTVLRFHRTDWKQLLTGIVLLGGSLAWFFAVTGYLAKSGDGVMTYRYENFIYDGSSSLITVVKAVLMNPMKAVFECVDSEKLQFIAQTMLPLLGLPLLTRRYERYILLIPYILLNLMSDYRYQHDMFFQYTFGSAACLMYLTAVNLADWKIDARRVCALAGAVVVATSFFMTFNVPTALNYPKLCVQYADFYAGVREALDKVPDGASVTASTFYTTYLSRRETLYDVRYCTRAHMLETEYVVLRVSSSGDYKRYATAGKNDGFDNLVDILKENGYELFYKHGSVLEIYKKENKV